MGIKPLLRAHLHQAAAAIFWPSQRELIYPSLSPLLSGHQVLDNLIWHYFKLGRLSRTRAKAPHGRSLFPVSVAKQALEYCYSLLDGMLVHRRVTPQKYVASTHLYTSGWRETNRSKVPCLRKQRNGRGFQLRTSRSRFRGVNRSAIHAFNMIRKIQSEMELANRLLSSNATPIAFLFQNRVRCFC